MLFFIRHNQLKAPFDNYDNLLYTDLCKLSDQTISPLIQSQIKQTEIVQKINNSNIDFVFVSEQKRTQETSKLL
ncbi:MAG: phosphoglycerate mutase family protein [bacterium]|nr:phosphoglycerate mutase family protein [bacterium]